MKSGFRSLGLAVLLSASAWGQHSVWIAVAAATVANVGDGITTVSCQHHYGQNCRETWSPWLYGTHPTYGSYFAPAFAIEAGQGLLAWRAARSKRRTMRVLGMFQLWAGCAGHATGMAWNLATHAY